MTLLSHEPGAEVLADRCARLAALTVEPTLSAAEAAAAALSIVVEHLAGHASASVSRPRGWRWLTGAATDGPAADADALQRTCEQGPSRDAVASGLPVVSTDVAADTRWPRWGPAVARTGVRAVLSHPLPGGDGERGCLAVYLDRPDGSGRLLRETAAVAAAAALAFVALEYRHTGDHLRKAVESNRQIGTAIGILMARRGWTEAQAFDELRLASQHANRKLRDLADWVTFTGDLPRRLPTDGGVAALGIATRRSLH
ncbi:GAF and ANTAR domain-containing protein [Nakamurella endophytica]|uniref:ANTAR domain-containing protein n=1 Tax=Nakamurella endophytica TaxID=1748367 RepID=A0A917SWU0_9ACTN|nr:GAF and ANTAR domain-containing protein [Nakamurella endophytica]GGM01946.1 hypothetical protein GCM10011594_22530 [Nakamurella endophytica]